MSSLDHPARHDALNEMHARPFAAISSPARAVFLAIMAAPPGSAEDQARAELLRLLDRSGAAHPPPQASHHSTQLGAFQLKWERHTEFVTYTLFCDPAAQSDDRLGAAFPPDWLAEVATGKIMGNVIVDVRPRALPDGDLVAQLERKFSPESLAVSAVVDSAAVIAGDFLMDSQGRTRFEVQVIPDIPRQRTGRIVQRLCEIEIYRAMSMLGLQEARRLAGDLNRLDPRLSALVQSLGERGSSAETALAELRAISAELESLSVTHSYRFAATRAYEALVHQRIAALREARLEGRQTFADFMLRRFDPAMRTVTATANRLANLSDRAARAAELLSTQVEVARSAENQALLASMDRRGDQALRLQQTVEGLSVAAISYYALGLLGYLVAPMAEATALSKDQIMAALVVPVIALAWLSARVLTKRLRAH